MNILKSKISQGGERWVRVRIKTSSSSDSSNLQKGGFFGVTRAGSVCWRLPPSIFPLLQDMHQQLIGGNHLKKEKHKYGNLGWRGFLCTVRTSAVAAVLILWHFLACAELSCKSKPCNSSLFNATLSSRFNTHNRATWEFRDSRNSLILLDTLKSASQCVNG